MIAKAKKYDLFNLEFLFRFYNKKSLTCNSYGQFSYLTSIFDQYSNSENFQKVAFYYAKKTGMLELCLMAYHLNNKDLKDFIINIARQRIENTQDVKTKTKYEIYLSITDNILLKKMMGERITDLKDEDYDKYKQKSDPMDYIFKYCEYRADAAGYKGLSKDFGDYARSHNFTKSRFSRFGGDHIYSKNDIVKFSEEYIDRDPTLKQSK
ncbi:MAG: hypothetical protein ACRYGR_02115 [Janthinobacterium lividum]